MCDTWKISPPSYRFRSSAAMKPIYLLILLLFQTTFTTPDCPSWLDQTQVSTWCPHAVDQQNPIIFGFLKQFSLPFFHRLFFYFMLQECHQSLQLHNPLISLYFCFPEVSGHSPMCIGQKVIVPSVPGLSDDA